MLWQPALPDRYLKLTDADLAAAIRARRAELGSQLLILGHHYQQDDVIQHADFTGDSLKLSQLAAEQCAKRASRFIIFCGVHFMAETADILTPPDVQVMLPDLTAGCSMADMADRDQVEECWESLHAAHGPRWNGRIVPITYVNSSADIKAFVGAHGGACCTSSNATEILRRALAGGDKPKSHAETVKAVFLPDQHLGRNTASRLGFTTEVDAAPSNAPADDDDAGPASASRAVALTVSLSTRTRKTSRSSTASSSRPRRAAKPVHADTLLWSPKLDHGGTTPEQLLNATIYLWAGHCSVHKLFRPEHIDDARARFPGKPEEPDGITVLVHPECCKEVVDKADLSGSTEFIIKTINVAPPGSNWFLGTETHLVVRLAREAKTRGVNIHMLSDCQCLCTTMYRIDQPHLLWTLDHLVKGEVVNRISVPDAVADAARLALNRMLAHTRTLTVMPITVD